MEKIKWCLEQKKGLELVAPSTNLRHAYEKKAEEALQAMRTSQSKDWQLIAAYYSIYESLYALLMALGVKCEIHSCTIEFTKQYLKSLFSEEDLSLIDDAFSARIDSQYYVDRSVAEERYKSILESAPNFVVKCKNIVATEQFIQKTREKLEKF